MSEKVEKLVKDVRTELSEVVVADKESARGGVLACLMHAKELIETFIRKELVHEEDS